jgi:hypothetical protein
VVNRRSLQLVLAIGVMSLLGAVGVAVATGGGGKDIRESLNGYEETPLAVSTAANGDFRLSIDRRRQEMHYRLSYEDFTSPVLQAHIHFGSESQSGGISVFLCTNLGNGPAGTQPCPSPSGTVTGTIRPGDIIGPSAQGIAAGEFDELVSAIRAGYTYANVHSQAFPPGEIRAQLEDDRGRDW